MNSAKLETAFAGKSKEMKHIYEVIEKIACLDINVLISGESGSGKEAMARIIHERSGRKGVFSVFDGADLCPDIDERGIEEAIYDALYLCENGTLLIDNVANVSAKVQVKLAAILKHQNRGQDTIVNRVRFIASTNRNLSSLARQGRFRQDLCNILGVVSIEIPPLRQRREDILELAYIFIKEHYKECSGNKTITKDAAAVLLKYDWPGNVRELENTIIQAAIVSDSSEIDANHLPSKVKRKNAVLSPKATVTDELYKLAKGLIESGIHLEKAKPYEEYIKIVEVPIIQAVMDMCEGNKSLAAKHLKINRNTLSKKLLEHGIE